MKMVAEGVLTTGAALALGERGDVEPPSTQMAKSSTDAPTRTALDAPAPEQRAEAEAG
jgi:hypothetical protein